MKNKFLILLAILCVFMSGISILNNNKEVVKADNDSAEIVMELNSHRVLYAKNIDEKKYMASTTKILTAITVIENSDLDKLVTVTKNTTGIEGSSIYLEAGEILSIKNLLYGLMLRSGNDCAETLAVSVGGSREIFIDLMNKTALKAGAKNSNFINPHGLHDDNHYTTAYDLALISCYAMKNQIFREIVSTKSIDIPFTTRGYNRHLVNKNKMLFNYDGATGIKTGYTKKAGRCLVSSCNKNGMELICVVLNCPPMFEKSMELFNRFYTEYVNYKLVESDHIIAFTNTENGEKCGLYIKEDIVLPLTEYERENIEIVYDYPNSIKNTKKDSEVGEIKIYCKNNLIFTQKIYTIIDVE